MSLACPNCRVDLVMAERQGVEIDYCPKCRGVWLDRGELDKIIERAEAPEPRPAGPGPAMAVNDGLFGSAPRPDPRYRSDQRDYHRRDDDDDHYKHGHKRKKNWLSDLFD